MMKYVLGFVLLSAAAATVGCNSDETAPVSDPLSSPDVEATAVANATGSWSTRAPYPRDWWAATSAAVTAANGHSILYVIGGAPPLAGPGKISQAVKAYDVESNTWTNKASYPVPVWQTNGAATIGGKIYVTGGQSRRFDEAKQGYVRILLRSLYIYDPTTNRWTRGADMPNEPVGPGATTTFNNYLYVATGCGSDPVCGGDSEHGALWRYNPKNNNWVLLTRTPHDPTNGGLGSIGGKLYLVAGQSTDVYNVATNTWSTGPTRSGGACFPSYATAKAKLYVTCPSGGAGSTIVLQVLDPTTGWSSLGPTPNNAGGPIFTMSKVDRAGQVRLELVGGDNPTNNLQFTP
jgi:hypothetical protein